MRLRDQWMDGGRGRFAAVLAHRGGGVVPSHPAGWRAPKPPTRPLPERTTPEPMWAPSPGPEQKSWSPDRRRQILAAELDLSEPLRRNMASSVAEYFGVTVGTIDADVKKLRKG
jgi:hypothetical protein